MHHLNKNGQYGVVLYSNGDLIVPAPDGTKMKHFTFEEHCSRCYSAIEAGSYWDVLRDKECGTEQKQIFMTYEAVSSAFTAFRYSIPVICLDGCTIKCQRVRAVLLTATFQTTEKRLLTMCFGTAPNETNESWGFFLLNLRQALQTFRLRIDYTQIVFMSDRHPGIINGVRSIFPKSKHLYCTVHLERNLSAQEKQRISFWDAVEATTQQDFDDACGSHQCSKTLSQLKTLTKHWSRFAIRADGCRRYGVRTNNWAESQNNALMKIRSGSILKVLMNCFKYTTDKVALLRHMANNLQLSTTNPEGQFTDFAEKNHPIKLGFYE